MNARTPAPPGLRWAASPSARGVALLLAVLSLLVSIYVGYRYVGLVDCLKARDLEDQERTRAIAVATDGERRADLALILGPIAGGPDERSLRADAVTARRHTDAVRAANPPPEVKPCS